jgi:hypothetical protein
VPDSIAFSKARFNASRLAVPVGSSWVAACSSAAIWLRMRRVTRSSTGARTTKSTSRRPSKIAAASHAERRPAAAIGP